MKDPKVQEETEYYDSLPGDIRIHKISVPGGWIYIIYIQRREGDTVHTIQLSSLYVPGRR